MKHSVLVSTVLLLTPSILQAAALPPELAASVPELAASVPELAASVNGFAITKQSVDEEVFRVMREQSQGRVLTSKKMSEVRDSMYRDVLERMIDDRLLDEEVERRGMTVSAEELRAEMANGFDIYILSTGLPRSFTEEQTQATQGVSLDEFIAQRSTQPEFARAILHKRLVQALHPEETRVTPEELEAHYAAKAASDFTFPTVVRASHILFGVEERDKERRKKALETAQAVRERVARPGVDFAAMARTHSTCTSAPQGGDLGFFKREKMVKPFADAAFSLSVGAVSEVVESQFGYHVILVTDRSEGRTLSLKEATPAIVNILEVEKVDRMRAEVAAKLRESASIEYGDASQG